MTTRTISSGQTVTRSTVSSGNSQIVLSGGLSIDVTVRVGGTLLVSQGGTISNATVSGQQLQSAGRIDIAGGDAFGTRIVSGGAMTVSGGETFGTTVIGAAYNGNFFQASQEIVNAGGVASATIVGSQGYLEAGSGGTLQGAVIGDGGSMAVLDGGMAIGTNVKLGAVISTSGSGRVRGTTLAGSMTIDSGATAIRTVIRGGAEIVRDGTDRGGKIHNGRLEVALGGKANDTTIYAGGFEEVLSTCTARDVTISSGGVLKTVSGADIIGITVSSGGLFYNDGGQIAGLTILSGGAELLGSVSAGITVRNSLIENGYSQTVDVGGTSIAARVFGGGEQNVAGTATRTVLGGHNAGTGYQNLTVGSARYTRISAGGTQDIGDRASAASTTVRSGGLQNVFGVADGTIIAAGGSQTVQGYGIARSTTIRAGGTQIVTGSALVDGVVIGSGGTIVLSGGSVSAVQLHGGGAIDLSDVRFGKSERISFVANAAKTGGTLTISEGSLKTRIALLGQYAAAGFHSAGDGHGGTSIVYSAPHGAVVEIAGSLR